MSKGDTPDPVSSKNAAPKRKMFGNGRLTPRLSPQALERQSRIALLAWNLLGGDAAITFLNTYNPELEARPIDLAIESAAGCEAVEHAISASAGAFRGSPEN